MTNSFSQFNQFSQLGGVPLISPVPTIPTTTTSPVPVYTGNTSGGGTVVVMPQTSSNNGRTSLNLATIFSGGVSIASQLISAFGRNPTQQVGVIPGVQSSVSGVQYTQPQQGTYPQGYNPQTQQNGTNPNIGATVGTGLDGIFGFFLANPLYLVAIFVMLFLLFRTPPGSRR